MRSASFSFVAVVIMAALVFPFQEKPKDSKEKAPNFTLKMADGKSVSLSKLKGKVVLINFWATWCGPCRAEIPGFLEVYNKYKAKGLEIVGISLDETGWQDIMPFVKRYNVSYPIVLGNDKVARSYGDIFALPTSFVVDKKGFIVDKHVGLLTREMLENKIKDLL